MAPFIGLCGSIDKEETKQFIPRDYMRAVSEAGGIPVLLGMDMARDALWECARRVDGLLLAGGDDVAPERYGQLPAMGLGEVHPLRDEAEIALIQAFAAAHKPIFGICRGIQIINVAFGGTLYQDLPGEYRAPGDTPGFEHRQTRPMRYPSHRVAVRENSLLRRVLQKDAIAVNSSHHQAVRDVAPGFAATANAEDGVIEAIEREGELFFLGVQWHPERTCAEDPHAASLFRAFVQAASQTPAKEERRP